MSGSSSYTIQLVVVVAQYYLQKEKKGRIKSCLQPTLAFPQSASKKDYTTSTTRRAIMVVQVACKGKTTSCSFFDNDILFFFSKRRPLSLFERICEGAAKKGFPPLSCFHLEKEQTIIFLPFRHTNVHSRSPPHPVSTTSCLSFVGERAKPEWTLSVVPMSICTHASMGFLELSMGSHVLLHVIFRVFDGKFEAKIVFAES